MHDVVAIFSLPNSIWKVFSEMMSDARETAVCSFTGIAHISEKTFHMLLAVNIGRV